MWSLCVCGVQNVSVWPNCVCGQSVCKPSVCVWSNYVYVCVWPKYGYVCALSVYVCMP